ncbi:FAD binding domain-containing protein isoform 1 [Cladophialophora immunda]|nr:FAD binding domain-containing protein isoform 1 [Cladophialophora immunda]
MSGAEQLERLRSILSSDETVPRGSDLYRAESLPWAAQKDLNPSMVIRPKSIESLSKALAHLSKTDLSLGIRSQGVGSASAKDVLISMTAFDDVDFDRQNEIVTVGAGQSWGQYYEKMDKIAPGYATISVRTPSVGVGGSILGGGYSWLSSEYGLTSDPVNLLDAQVVKVDGTILWASEEPDLLWALRGTNGAFAVVTRFKLRARKYEPRIWGGYIFIPKTELRAVVQGIAAMDAKPPNPKVALGLFVMRKEQLIHIGAKEDMLMILAFDALGETHGRGDDGFGWALDCPGAVDTTKIIDLSGMAKLQGSVGKRASLFFEIFTTRDSLTSNTDSAWPRPQGFQHKITIGAGTDIGASTEETEMAKELVKDGPGKIVNAPRPILIVPNAMEDFHDPITQVYREHYPRLQALKKRYDPDNRLGGPVRLV